MMGKPVERRRLPVAQAGDGFTQHGKRGAPAETPGGAQGAAPLAPAVARLAPWAVAACAPHAAPAVGARCPVRRGCHALDVPPPQRLAVLLQAPGNRPRGVRPRGGLRDARLPRPPLPPARPRPGGRLPGGPAGRRPGNARP